MRAVPLILVLFWLYFTLPLLTGHPVGALGSALVAFVLFESAFYCEIVRAGLGAVPAGQVLAARASGLRPAQVLRLVVGPQALRAMAPLLVSQVVILFQDTSLVYVVSLRDFLTAASVVAARDDRPAEMYGFVADRVPRDLPRRLAAGGPSRPHGVPVSRRQGRMFFFEKRTKNVCPFGTARAHVRCQKGQSLFAFFFRKRRRFLLRA